MTASKAPAKSGPVADGAQKAPAKAPHPARPHSRLPGNQALLRIQRKCSCGGSGTCPACLQQKPAVIQRSIAVGPEDDPFEREADSVAERVMRMPHAEAAIQRHADRAVSGPSAPPALSPATLTGGGEPLSESARGFFEPRFGRDFSGVRVHSGLFSESANHALQSHAFTYGQHIWLGRGQTATENPIMAHELTHVVQQAQSGHSQPLVLRRRPDDEQKQPPTTKPADTSGGAATAKQAANPGSQWSPDIPYIHFDLLDFYRSLYVPAGPYYYSAYRWLNRSQNDNFSKDLNPGPARNTSIVNPHGWHPQKSDLEWVFATKFYVDSAAAPLPNEPTEIETQADIKFTLAQGGIAFEDHFTDNSPTYVRPSPSYAFSLTTKPYGFAATHTITEAGTLEWSARLRIAQGGADVPVQFKYSAPSDCPDMAAFTKELADLGIPNRAPPEGKKPKIVNVIITRNENGGFAGKAEYTEPDGAKSVREGLDHKDCKELVKIMALVVAIAIDPDLVRGAFGVSKKGLVEIKGPPQKVKFEPSSEP